MNYQPYGQQQDYYPPPAASAGTHERQIDCLTGIGDSLRHHSLHRPSVRNRGDYFVCTLAEGDSEPS